MIYLKRCNLVFLKPHKVAGTSFEIALSCFANGEDIVTNFGKADERLRVAVGGKSPRNHRPTPRSLFEQRYRVLSSLRRYRRPRRFHEHMTATELLHQLGDDCFWSTTKVTIVRNPFDQLVSLYHWRRGKQAQPCDFRNWLKAHPAEINLNQRYYFIGSRPAVDFFLTFENLLEDSLKLEQKFPKLKGLSEKLSSISAKSGRRPTHDVANYFGNDSELLAAVSFFNRDLIDRFSYEIPGSNSSQETETLA